MHEETSQDASVVPAVPSAIRQPLGERFRILVDRQDWLEGWSKAVQRVVGGLLVRAGPSFADLLHGTWLGHPLHPALTDVPLGAWTAGAALDVLDLGAEAPRFEKAADAALAVGVAAAVPTALAGIADWRHVNGYPRRLGLIHGGLNAIGLVLTTSSLILRLTGRRRSAIACSSIGYFSSFVSAWLGAELVYRQGIGVDHTAFEEGPKDFVPVMLEHELPEGRPHRVIANGVPVLLSREGAQIYAISETCSHQGGPLAKGEVHEGIVTCPWHGSQYHLEDGGLVHGPSTFDQPRFDVRLRDGRIEVRKAIVN